MYMIYEHMRHRLALHTDEEGRDQTAFLMEWRSRAWEFTQHKTMSHRGALPSVRNFHPRHWEDSDGQWYFDPGNHVYARAMRRACPDFLRLTGLSDEEKIGPWSCDRERSGRRRKSRRDRSRQECRRRQGSQGLTGIRHIDVKYLWLQDAVKQKMKEPSATNLADVGTKFLMKGTLQRLRELLGLWEDKNDGEVALTYNAHHPHVPGAATAMCALVAAGLRGQKLAGAIMALAVPMATADSSCSSAMTTTTVASWVPAKLRRKGDSLLWALSLGALLVVTLQLLALACCWCGPSCPCSRRCCARRKPRGRGTANKGTQSQCTYTSVRGSVAPRFKLVDSASEGCWSD